MYHMEFYKKILAKTGAGLPLLSGIIGDAWAGSVEIGPINSPAETLQLGYSHGVAADPDQCLLKAKDQLSEKYFEENRYKLKDPLFRVIESMRFKMILLCYLIKVPERFGFHSWSPFLDLDIATSMLNLPVHRRTNRLWQAEYFKKNNLDLESLNLPHSRENNLDKQGIKTVALQPLSVSLLRELIRPAYVEWINKNIRMTNPFRIFATKVISEQKMARVARRLGFRDNVLSAYNAYVTLKPIESMIKKRNSS
jgi:hypothetical protein